MEEIIEVKTYQVKYKCDSCKNGYLIFNGKTDKMDRITRYHHSCSNHECSISKYFIGKYPFIEYKNAIEIEIANIQNDHLENHVKNQEKPNFQPNNGNGYQPNKGVKGKPPKKR